MLLYRRHRNHRRCRHRSLRLPAVARALQTQGMREALQDVRHPNGLA